MMDRREVGLAATVLLVFLIGVAVEVFADEVTRGATPITTGPRFVERALFCPPSVADSTSFAVAAALDEEPVSLGVEPARPDRVDLEPGRVFVQELLNGSPTQVVGYGSPVRAGALLRARGPIAGEAAARCSDRASSTWFFAAGASTLEVDERLIIYNPFPDEAVVRVTFLTPLGEQRKGNLADIPVAAKTVTSIQVNRFVRLERTLGVRVDTKRGRVVAWRALFDDPAEGSGGVQLTLGAASDADAWFFPEGTIAPGAEQRISMINPNDEEATVTITLSGDDKLVQPDELVEIPVGPGTARGVTLRNVLGKRRFAATGVSAVVQSTNGVGVVAERSIRYDAGGPNAGSTAEVGAARVSREWMLPPAVLRPRDDAVVVMNPGSQPARVSLAMVSQEKGPVEPGPLQDISLPPGSRKRIDVTDWTRLETVLVDLTSTTPVVAERVAYSEVTDDVGSVIGFPLE